MRKYSKINESKIEQEKEKLVQNLDQYKNYILSNIEYNKGQILYKGFETLDVDQILAELTDALGDDTMKTFNVEPFLRKIKQIVDLKKKDIKKSLKDRFIAYYISLDNRIEELEGKDDENTVYDDYVSNYDGEKSIIPRKQYEKEKFNIQVELLKLQEWVKSNGKKVVIVFEGRDSAGKGSTIKRFTEFLDPRGFKVVALGVPTEEEKNNWFGRYEKYMPNPGEIVFFDRSWYNRAVVEPSLGYCTEEQYNEFMENLNDWEEKLQKSGIILIKIWFSITKEKQLDRFKARQTSPLTYWKFSPNDAKVVNKWDTITHFKNEMFKRTATPKSPWVIIDSNDKRVGRLNAMRYVLNAIDYEGKDENISSYYPEVVTIIK